MISGATLLRVGWIGILYSHKFYTHPMAIKASSLWSFIFTRCEFGHLGLAGKLLRASLYFTLSYLVVWCFCGIYYWRFQSSGISLYQRSCMILDRPTSCWSTINFPCLLVYKFCHNFDYSLWALEHVTSFHCHSLRLIHFYPY